MEGRKPGWRADPAKVGGARYWDGNRWTALVAWGGFTRIDDTPLTVVAREEARAEADIVTAYLDDAAGRGVVTTETAQTLRSDVMARIGVAVARATGAPTTPVVTAAPAAARPVAAATPAAAPARPAVIAPRPPTPVAAGPVPLGPVPAGTMPTGTVPVGTVPVGTPVTARPVPVPVPPGRAAAWWADVTHAVRSDLALHGLAYLGVLLLFAGVTGLIVFSFGDVAPWVRTVAEFLLPAALAVSARYLRHRGAGFVSVALAVLGGAITPIVVAASLTDGAPFPPDLSGRALAAGQGLAVAACAAVMALMVRRSPESGLRFTAGPALWLAAGLAAAAARDEVPTGYESARPGSVQLAVFLALLTATVWACTWRRVPAALARATGLVALPTAAAVGVIELVLAGNEGWPLVSTAVAGLALVAVLEAAGGRLPFRLPDPAVGLGQLALTGITAVRLVVRFDDPQHGRWVALGAAITLLALTEYSGRRRPSPVIAITGLALTAVGLALTLGSTAPSAIGFGLLALWGLARHLRPAAWLPERDDAGVVAAFGTTVTAVVLWLRSPIGPAMLVTAGLVLLVAGIGRRWPAVRQDLLWRWFTPAAAAAVTLATPTAWTDRPVEAAVATVSATAALALTTLPRSVRTWLCAGGTIWASALAAHAIGLGAPTQAVVLASAALALVVIALVVARGICAHLAVIGQLAGIGAFAALQGRGWAATWVTAAATLGWLVTTVVDERTEAVHLGAFRRVLATSWAEVSPAVDDLGPLACLVGTGATAMLAGDAAGWVLLTSAWATVPAGVVAALGAAAARLVPWRRAHRIVLALTGTIAAATVALIAVTAVGADRDHWAPVVCLAVGLAAVVAMPARRPTVASWLAWTELAVLVAFTLDRLGLDRNRADVGVATWGALVLVGALALNRRRHGPVATGSIPRDRLLAAPIALGALGFVGGGAIALTDPEPVVVGWTALGLGAVVAAVALLLPLGALIAGAEILGAVAFGLLAPWEPDQLPWTFAPVVVALLLVAWATHRPGAARAARWDLPSFVVAHGVAAMALQFGVVADRIPATFLAIAVPALGIAVVLRRSPWAVASGLLVLVAAGDSGPGWLALVLAIEGVLLDAAALRIRHSLQRTAVAALGALFVVSAWFYLGVWQDWSTRSFHLATVAGALTIGLVAAVALRTGKGPRTLTGVWTVAGQATAMLMALIGPAEIGRRQAGLGMAATLAVASVISGLVVPLVGPRLRWVTALLAAAATVPAAWALSLSDPVSTLAGTGTALAVLGAVLALHGPRPGAVWLHPAAAGAMALQALAAATAVHHLPDRSLVVVVLLAVAAECIALAVITALPHLHVAAPAAACAAWLVFAADALAGDANWFTAPIGLTLLVMVGLVRWIRRGRGGNPNADELVGLELAAMSVLVGPALARTLTGHLWNGAIAIAIGVGLALWGATTRVRWRAAFGAGSIGIATALLIGVPLSGAITWRGPALWITLSVVGMTAIVAAAAIERSRDDLRRLAHRLDDMTAGWEGIHHPRRPDDRHPGGPAGTTPAPPPAPPLAPT